MNMPADLESVWPPRPELYDEVQWGALPTAEDYEQAFRAWSRPYHALPDPDSTTEFADETEAVRTARVLEVLVRRILCQIRQQETEIPEIRSDDPPSNESSSQSPDITWTLDQFLLEAEGVPAPAPAPPPADEAMYDGRRIMTAKNFTVAQLQKALGLTAAECRKQNLRKADLQLRLRDRECAKHQLQQDPPQDVQRKLNLLPRADLKKWNSNGVKSTMIPYDPQRRYTAFDLYTCAIIYSPYNPAYWVARAYMFYGQGDRDLALGDAYRAMTLTDVIVNVHKRAKRPGLYSRVWDAIEQHIVRVGRTDPTVKHQMTKSQGVPFFTNALRKTFHHIISLSLVAANAISDFATLDRHLRHHVILEHRDRIMFETRYYSILAANKSWGDGEDQELVSQEEAYAGYLQNRPSKQFEEPVDRHAPEFLLRLSHDYIQNWNPEANSKPLLRVEAENGTHESGVTVVTCQHISKGTVIYAEEPSIRGQTQWPRKHADTGFAVDFNPEEAWRDHYQTQELRCENCMRPCKPAIAWRLRKAKLVGDENVTSQCACLLQDPALYFCPVASTENAGKDDGDQHERNRKRQTESPDGNLAGPTAKKRRTNARSTKAVSTRMAKAKTGHDDNQQEPSAAPEDARRPGREGCLAIARQLFHHRSCGQNWGWLYEAVQHFADDDQLQAAPHEKPQSATLGLLLRDVFDMTLLRREVEVDGEPHLLAHEIDALYPLSEGMGRRFPFSWAANIVVPFDILETLGVNIYRELDFDTWVIQRVIRKLMINAVPWGPHRRPSPRRDDGTEIVDQEDTPSLYLHTGFSLFNHACGSTANASWRWDTDKGIPNRIVVVADRDLAQGEEVRINYFPDDAGKGPSSKSWKLFGRACDCEKCSLEEERNKRQRSE
ncbi:MAG: hypothetical protein M1817_001859 [Caeruleum heppii]|nr:MAG: hypothetical protein M1817_001859 [Caeruleum heppii]